MVKWEVIDVEDNNCYELRDWIFVKQEHIVFGWLEAEGYIL